MSFAMKFVGAAGAVAAVAGLAGMTPASAADLGRPSIKDDGWRDAAPARYNWTGLYAGAHVGGGFGRSSHTDTGGATTGGFDTDGYIGGGQVGYNLQAGSIVYGLETDISATDISGNTFTGCAGGCSSQLDWLWTLRGRIGIDMGGFMPYITGGLAVGDASASTNGISASETLTGWTVGGGVEMKLDKNWSIKGEYLYVDLGDVRVPTATPTDARFDDIHIIRGGLNFKF